MFNEIKRYVTGFDADGNSVFIDEGVLEPVEVAMVPGTATWPTWGTADGVPSVGANHSSVRNPFYPGPGGTRIHLHRFAPASAEAGAKVAESEEQAAMQAQYQRDFPGLMEVYERDNPGFHSTDTIDYLLVLDGELVLQLDNGVERTLQPGDFVVQQGTRHAWLNRGEKPALCMFVIVGATRE